MNVHARSLALTITITITIIALSLIVSPRSEGNVYKQRISPNWAPDNSYFWYRNDLPKGAREFILVDVTKGIRARAFDHQRLAEALAEAGAGEPNATQLPLEDLSFDLPAKTTNFRSNGRYFSCDLNTYQISKVEKPAPPKTPDAPKPTKAEDKPEAKPYRVSRDVSPDGKWRAFIQDHNLFVSPVDGDEKIQLSKDGQDKNSYQQPFWAPNSNNLVAFRMQAGKVGEVHLLESSPKEGGRANLHTRRYALPGDKFSIHELNWFDLKKREHKKPEVDLIDFGGPRLRWTEDGRHFRYETIDRGHQRLRLVEVDSISGQHRNIIDEQSKTFIWTEHALRLGMSRVNWLKETKEILYLSEKDGHRHIYLVDVESGSMKPVTQGSFVVRYVNKVDEERRQIWFQASGRNKGQDPYLKHFYRVNFDGSGFTALTEGNGDHEIRYSPDQKFIIDSYSRIDLAPVHELRGVSDGKLVCNLEKSDITELEATGWEPPEVFSAPGRDGTTGIWGIVCKPKDFDPNKKYPVLEDMYAGPHDSYVPKRWSSGRRYSWWTDMGFVVIKVDGMGTANRSKAFHDVCWQNLKDAGFPDRILWHKAYAKQNPWYDITRVGIYGGSAGGQSSTGALLFHPEFYKVAVSSCGCHDNRMDKASWNEQWMGYPVGPHYSESSNIDNAHRLQGRLLLIVGEMDRNVPPESTTRLADALIKANKDFDFIVVPGAGHGGGGRHGDRRRKDFFRKHLLGIEPPNYNQSE